MSEGSFRTDDRRRLLASSSAFAEPTALLSADSHLTASERPSAVGTCPGCGSGLLPALTICPRCGEAVPDNASSPRYLVLRGGPARPSARRETVRLLADAENGPVPAEVERQLRDLPALFCAPLPDATIARLAERIRRSGYRVDVLGAFPEGLGLREHFEWVLARLSRVLPYLAGLSASVALFWNERYWLAQLVAGLVALFGFFDRRRFLKQATLRAPRLATRLDMAPEAVEDALGGLLRDPGLSEPLRDALSSLLGEYGRLLDTLSPFTAQYPDLVRPTSRALAQLARHAAVTAERALAIEKAGDFTDPTLPDRLASLRSLGSQEIERRASQLLASHHARRGRLDWLREIHGTLLVRLEAVTDTMRSVRQRVLESYLNTEADVGSAVTDRLAAALAREQQVVAATVAEMETLDRRMLDLAVE